MLAHFQQRKNSSLDISINNAIQMETNFIKFSIEISQKYQFYLNIEELSAMRDVILMTFENLSPERVDICNLPLAINNTYREWNVPDIPQLNIYLSHVPYSYAYSNEMNDSIYTYVDAKQFYETPEVVRLATNYKQYYTNMLQERYMLLREFHRGIYEIKREKYLENFSKKLPRDLQLMIVSYLGDWNGSQIYFGYLDNLMGVIT
tara:strand:- start:1190 stop:1804 length:615 start_codon:yes stop_codon:yes gene_type:complete